MPLPDDLLRRDAGDALRLVVMDLVAAARAAAPRCLDPDDEEGLHDFRVAIRRLRSALSAWKRSLRGVVRKRDRRALAGFQKRTGASRDAEVALEWLEEQVEALASGHRPGYEWVAARLRSGSHVASGDGRRELCADFVEWADDFESRLAGQVQPVRGGAGQQTGDPAEREHEVAAPYARALAGHLDRIARRLDARVNSLGDDREDGPHRVRIACKRLRYLVEPARAECELAVSLVERCKRLQDVLGALNDANVLDDLLSVYLEDVPTTSESGVLALRRLNAARAAASYRSFRVDWLDDPGGMRTLLDEAAGLASQLRE